MKRSQTVLMLGLHTGALTTRAALLDAANLTKNGQRTVKVNVHDGAENKGSVVGPVFKDLLILPERFAERELGRLCGVDFEVFGGFSRVG